MFDSGFDLLFMICWIFIAVCIVFVIATRVQAWSRNNSLPVNEAAAVVTHRRTQKFINLVNANIYGHNTTSHSYYITFLTKDGKQIEFKVTNKDYHSTAEGEKGILTFQGTRYISFQKYGG